jgi:hypothetical protein
MKITFWLGLMLLGQSAGFLTIRKYFSPYYFYWSLGLGVAGVLMLLWQSARRNDSLVDVDKHGYSDSEEFGSQILGLGDAIDGHGD